LFDRKVIGGGSFLESDPAHASKTCGISPTHYPEQILRSTVPAPEDFDRSPELQTRFIACRVRTKSLPFLAFETTSYHYSREFTDA